MDLDVRPESPLVQAPITAVVSGGGSVRVEALDPARAGDGFDVPVLEGKAQFYVSLPGRYEVRWGGASREVTVLPRQDLGFAAEFGFFSAVVVLCLGGMLLWMKKKAGSSSRSGPR